MHIEYYKEFLVLAELLNYSAAAEKLFISQPVLSRHIQTLEEHFGIQLFERNTQVVRLTEIGEGLASEMQILLNNYDYIVEKYRNNYNIHRITVGVPPYAINDYLREIPNYIEHNHSDTKVNYVTGDPVDLNKDLLAEKVDVVIVPHFALPASKQLSFFDLYMEQLGILINKNNPLSKKNSININDLANEKILTVSNDFFTEIIRTVYAHFEKNGMRPAPPKLFDKMMDVLIEIDTDAGISINGSHMRNVPMDNIKFIPFDDESLSRLVLFCYKKTNKNPAIPLLKNAFDVVFHSEIFEANSQ